MSKAEATTDVLQRLKVMDAALEERAVTPQAPRVSEPVVVVRPAEAAVVRPVWTDTTPASPWFAGAGFFAVGLLWGLAALWMARRRYRAGSLAHAQQQAALETEVAAAKTCLGLLEQSLADVSSEAKQSRQQIEQLKAAALETQLAAAVQMSQQDSAGGPVEVDAEARAAVAQELEALRHANACLRSQHAESEWYLGEERAATLRVAEAAQHLQGEMERLRAELAESRQQRDEANWFLGEEKSANARLSLELEQLRAQLAPPAQAAWNGQERRHCPREAYDDASARRAELFDPVTGKRLGRGRAINLGQMGLGLKLAFLPLLGRFKDGRVRCRMPPVHGGSPPIESEGRIAWRCRGSGSSGEAGIAFDHPVTSSV
jgi:acyl transferase domain-containing protein